MFGKKEPEKEISIMRIHRYALWALLVSGSLLLTANIWYVSNQACPMF